MMPVVGPVDLWINHRLADLRVLALARPALLQRGDSGSDNAYSIAPYLARSGIVDAGPSPVAPARTGRGIVLAWNAPGARDALGMALSTLGYRVRTFHDDGPNPSVARLFEPEVTFDAWVDAKLDEKAIDELLRRRSDVKFVFGVSGQADGASETSWEKLRRALPAGRTAVVLIDAPAGNPWEPLTRLLELPIPPHAFPRGVAHKIGLFRADHADGAPGYEHPSDKIDESPWIIPPTARRMPQSAASTRQDAASFAPRLDIDLSSTPTGVTALTETFPGNMATFKPGSVGYGPDGGDFHTSEDGQRCPAIALGRSRVRGKLHLRTIPSGDSHRSRMRLGDGLLPS